MNPYPETRILMKGFERNLESSGIPGRQEGFLLLWDPFSLWVEFPAGRGHERAISPTGTFRSLGSLGTVGVTQAEPAGSSRRALSPLSRPEAPIRRKSPVRSPRQAEDDRECSKASGFRPSTESPAKRIGGLRRTSSEDGSAYVQKLRLSTEHDGGLRHRGRSIGNPSIGRKQIPSGQESPVLEGCI